MKKFIIDEEYSGVRIDRFIRKMLPNLALSEIYKSLRKGKIKVNNSKIKESYRVNENDEVIIYLNNKVESYDNLVNFIELSTEREKILNTMIVYENDDLFIINKNYGEVVHKGSGHNITLLEEYRSFFNNSNVNFVNRIDKETSGLVIGSKNIKTARLLAEKIRKKEIIKKYFALVNGKIVNKKFKIENFIKKDEENILVSETEKEGYKKCVTCFEVINSVKNYTLLDIKLETGRTHQIRIQLSNINFPIVGDTKYGIEKEEKMFLFSYYLIIPSMNIEIKLNVPNYFLNKLNLWEEKK